MVDVMASLSGVSARYDGVRALDAVDLVLPEGRIVGFCGPNGSGKSTALKVLRGLHPPLAGLAEVLDLAIGNWSPKALAREIAMLSQSPEAPFELTVGDLAMLGRFAHRSRFAGPSDKDRHACDKALAVTGLSELVDRPLGHLSGGQRQRAWIAMTLAQDAPRIFLDEPTNHLDIAHALEVLELIRKLNREEQRGFVIVLHDLNLALRYADDVALFSGGQVRAFGEASAVLEPGLVEDVFQVRCSILTGENGQRFLATWPFAERTS